VAEGRLALPWEPLAIAFALILAGAIWRWPTLAHLAHYDRFAFGRLAYSDVVKFYETRHLAAHHVPYLQQPFEYPVLTGVIIWLTALAPGIHGYFLTNAVLLCACLLACLVILARLTPDGRLWRFALAPALAFYAVLNWDAVAVLALTGAIFFLSRGRFLLAGMALGLGVDAKLFPILILPVALAYALRSADGSGLDRLRPALRLLAGALVPILALNLPLALLNWRGWSYFLVFQSARHVNPDSIWGRLPPVPSAVSSHILVDAVVIGSAWMGFRVWKGAPWQPAAMASLICFLAFTRDYSPQYDLWLLPFLVLLACPLWLWLLFVAADSLYYAAIFRWAALYDVPGTHIAGQAAERVALLNAAVWTREAALGILFAWGLTQMRGEPTSRGWSGLENLKAWARRPRDFGWRESLVLVLGLRIVLGLIAFISVQHRAVTFMQGSYTDRVIHGGRPWSDLISTWQRWDALYYQVIAQSGYRPDDGSAAFYPLYPLLSRAVSDILLGNIVVAELVVSTAACTVALWLLYRLARLDVSPRAALLTVLLIVCSPLGFFLLAPYTESLFLLLTVAAFWFARRNHPWLAGFAGLLAGLTRLQAYFLIPALAYIGYRRSGADGEWSSLDLLAAALPAVGIIAFSTFLRYSVGVASSGLGLQSASWGYHIVMPWQSLADSWRYITNPVDPSLAPIELLNLVSLLGCAVLALLALRRLPVSYALYTLPYLGLLSFREMGYTPLMSVDRYCLVLFPCFLVLAIWLERRPRLTAAWLVAGFLLQVLLLDRFVHFGFVG
jgi:hypothetical protein